MTRRLAVRALTRPADVFQVAARVAAWSQGMSVSDEVLRISRPLLPARAMSAHLPLALLSQPSLMREDQEVQGSTLLSPWLGWQQKTDRLGDSSATPMAARHDDVVFWGKEQ